MSDTRSCINCRFGDRPSGEEPCASCQAFEDWAPLPRKRRSACKRVEVAPESICYLPTDSAERKEIPMAEGCLDYFPAALAYVARISKAGNDKHNPGQPLHHARGKSMDHANCIMRHLTDRGGFDPEDHLRHTGKLAWRALALLQEELEREEGAAMARGARSA